MKKEKKEVRVCDCGAPLHWTFLFDGAEYFCMNCGRTGGMFGTGKDVPQTVETRAQRMVANDVFKALRKHLHGSGNFSRTNCKKCKSDRGYSHTQHASKYELKKNEVANSILDSIQGSFN